MSTELTPILEGRDHPTDLIADVDVAIVGSGASGAVTAKILAEAGLSVIVMEEGGYVSPERYTQFRPTQSFRQMYRDAGTTAAIGLGDTPLISILAGRTVGGSSVLTGGVIFRIPEAILASWGKDHGLVDFAPERMEEAYLSVERETSVELVPEEMRSRSTTLFGEGAKKLGYQLKPMRRNTKGCCGSARCNFGCSKKMSVDVTYLATARAHGALVVSDCKVTKLVLEGDRVTGVEGHLLSADREKRGKVRVKAKKVVIAGSALATPLLLKGARVGRWSRAVGRNLTLHPGFRVAALFDEEVYGWRGALQSAYSDAFEEDGLTLNSVFAPVNILAAMLPGIGENFHAYTSQMKHLATFGLMVHDDGGGRVWRAPGGRGVYSYRMSKRDKLRMLKGVGLLAKTFFEAGAREVLLPVFGSHPIRSVDELRFLEDSRFPARRFECVTFHPLGSARMGLDPRTSVVKPTGETHDVRGLYVVDGSVFPSSIGVNSQLPIMAVATKLAWGIRDGWGAASLAA